MSARRIDIEAICRLCLSHQNQELKSIFDETFSACSWQQKVVWLLEIQISKHDKLSTMVCNDCIIRLDTWFAYKKQCHKNQAKLAEWLNIAKNNGQELSEPAVQIKHETLDLMHSSGLLPVKIELNYDEDEYANGMDYSTDRSNDDLFSEDINIKNLETDDDRRCPDCGKMFGNSQNRRRHQNMMHAKRDRRFQMAEIRTPAVTVQKEKENQASEENVELEPAAVRVETDKIEKTEEKDEGTVNESVSDDVADKLFEEKNDSEPKEDSANTSSTLPINDDQPPVLERQVDIESISPKQENQQQQQQQQLQQKEEDKSQESKKPVPTENNLEKLAKERESSLVQKTPEIENDEKKIEFAAGLRLFQKDSSPIELEPLSKIELSYIEKCKAMVSMFHTLQCACHNVQHKTMRHLLSHLRETRIWFPLFTCYNCMISLTDRSTFTKHYSRCPKQQFDTLKKLSNLRKRSEIKPRLYQNFKCNRCKFLFSFHDDFCRHIDEDHAYGTPPFYCSCRYVFDSLEEYKTHCYSSCVLSYYCDICFITTTTVEEFTRHCQEMHDSSEGFILLQENVYIPRNHPIKHKEADDESNVLEGKRDRRKSSKEPIMVQIYDKEIPPDLKEIPTKIIRKMLHLDNVSESGWSKDPSNCPLCKKQYSSVNNMMRHYRTHIERKEVELPKLDDESANEDLYTCPDCGGVYPASKWKQHLQEKHSAMKCAECDKEFQFQSELDQHRSVHLNLKVYRDSKTQAYKSTMASPTLEVNGASIELLVMCEICEQVFNNKEELKEHKLTTHKSDDIMELDKYDNDANDGDNKNNLSVDSSRPYCENCDKFFASDKSLRDHVLNKHGSQFLKKNVYPQKCDSCDKVCTTGAALRTHKQMHERNNMTAAEKSKSEFPKQCEYCDRVCSTPAGLYLHTQMHERVTLGELKKKKDDKKKSAFLKPDAEEDESYHTCKRCFKVFGTKGKLKEHLKSHGIVSKTSPKKNRKVLCNLCHMALDNVDELNQHKLEEHNEELSSESAINSDTDSQSSAYTEYMGFIYSCDVCESSFNTRMQLKAHKETHSKPKNKSNALLCKYCKLYFDSTNELVKHLHSEHKESAKPKATKSKSVKDSDKPHKCPVCKKGFATVGAMTTHSGWHKRGLKYKKPVIENTPQATAEVKLAKRQKAVNKLAAAASTKQEPIEEPEFQCGTCLMELPNETALQIHALEKHGNLDELMLVPRCDPCNLDFNTQEQYETHKRFHTFLERQKTQNIQTPVIQSVESVAEPLLSSTKVKYACNWCSSSFSRQDTLNNHVKQHHKEHVRTEFECNQCDRVFDKHNALASHLKMHQRQKTSMSSAQSMSTSNTGKVYTCSLCNMIFNYPKDLRTHTIKTHPF